jgi:hypothetical protein
MKQTMLVALIFSFPAHTVLASDFRFCDMEGTVSEAILHKGNRARVYDFSVLVSSARPEKGERGKMGYTDCSEFVGKKVGFRLQLPNHVGRPISGDFIAFNYSAVDGFGADGNFAGTFINASLHSYQSVNSRPGANDAYDANLKELLLKAEALQSVSDAATKKAKEDPTLANRESADAASVAAAEAVIDASAFSAIRTIEAARSDSKENSDPVIVNDENKDK